MLTRKQVASIAGSAPEAVVPFRPGVGRPSRAQQAMRLEELLDAALDVFFENGFERATVDEIAKTVGMSKKTVYARFEDKGALFKVAISRAIARYAMPREAIEVVVTDDLEQSLLAIARLRIANATTPSSIRLQRILTGQAHRFPELNQAALDHGSGSIVEVLIELFQRHARRGEIESSDLHRTALAFLDLVVGRMARAVVLGIPPSHDETETQIRFATNIFLHGIRIR